MAEAATLPLAGIRILDLSAVLSGPIATALLCAQGAEVIKVEAPEGDTSRAIGPSKGDLSSVFITCNQGKRAITLDLKQPAAIELIHRFLAQADVVLDNFRPGVMTRLGLDAAELQARYPRLIVASVTGAGPDGPGSGARTYDGVVQAQSGMSASHRERSTGHPGLLPTLVCDKLTALTMAQAISAALVGRARDGRGRRVEVAMLDAALAFQWVDAMYNHVFIDEPPPAFPPYGGTNLPYATKDGHVVVMTPQASEFAGLCRGLGAPELLDDPRFATPATRMRDPMALRAALTPLFATRHTDELMQTLGALGVPIGRVNELDDVLRDPQVLHNRTLTEVPHGDVGRVRLARQAARFDRQPLPDPRPAPHKGEHGEALLAELGLGADEVAALVAQGVVRLPRA